MRVTVVTRTHFDPAPAKVTRVPPFFCKRMLRTRIDARALSAARQNPQARSVARHTCLRRWQRSEPIYGSDGCAKKQRTSRSAHFPNKEAASEYGVPQDDNGDRERMDG